MKLPRSGKITRRIHPAKFTPRKRNFTREALFTVNERYRLHEPSFTAQDVSLRGGTARSRRGNPFSFTKSLRKMV